MKVSVYLRPVKKAGAGISANAAPAMSSICFRVREKSVDIKAVSSLAVYDKYWDNDALAGAPPLYPPRSRNGFRSR